MSRHPETIQCEKCNGTRTVYFNRGTSVVAVGVPVECSTRHECRRETRAQFPYSASGEVAYAMREYYKPFLGGPSPVALALKRLNPLPEEFFVCSNPFKLHPYQLDMMRMITDPANNRIAFRWPRKLDPTHMGVIYERIVEGRRMAYRKEHFYDVLPVTWVERDHVAILPERGVHVTSEMVRDLEYKTDIGETT